MIHVHCERFVILLTVKDPVHVHCERFVILLTVKDPVHVHCERSVILLTVKDPVHVHCERTPRPLVQFRCSSVTEFAFYFGFGPLLLLQQRSVSVDVNVVKDGDCVT
jgi:hypothetical protein